MREVNLYTNKYFLTRDEREELAQFLKEKFNTTLVTEIHAYQEDNTVILEIQGVGGRIND